eukprot:bmy_12190T0
MCGRGKRGGKAGSEAKSRSSGAGLQFPVGQVRSLLCNAVLESLTVEILELAGNACRDNKETYISPCHLQSTVCNNEELNNLLGAVTIAQGGVLQHPRCAAAQED